MYDLQVIGWGVFDAYWREGVGGIPLMFLFLFFFSLLTWGWGGIPPIWTFLKNKRPTLIFARKQISRYPIGWIDCHVKVDQGRNERV